MEAPNRRKTLRRTRMVQERLNHIAHLLGNCAPHDQIIATCSKQWKVTTYTVREYIALVHQDWKERREGTPDYRSMQFDSIDYAFRVLYMKSLRAHKFSAAAKCLTELSKIHGIYAPEEHKVTAELTGGHVQVTAMGCASAEEVAARIDELKARFLKPAPAHQLPEVIEAEVVDESEE